MTWKKTLKRAPGVPASPLSSTQKMPHIVDVGWEMGGREACTWGHMWVCKRQRPQVLGEKQTAQIGLQVLGSKRTMTLRHDGVNIVSSRCCGSWHYNRKVWEKQPQFLFHNIKERVGRNGWSKKTGSLPNRTTSIWWGGPWVVGQRCSPNSPNNTGCCCDFCLPTRIRMRLCCWGRHVRWPQDKEKSNLVLIKWMTSPLHFLPADWLSQNKMGMYYAGCQEEKVINVLPSSEPCE